MFSKSCNDLVASRISIRRLALILESLRRLRQRTKDFVWLTEFVRQRLAPSICQAHCDHEGVIYATQLPTAVEEMIADRVRHETDDLAPDFPLAETRTIIRRKFKPRVAPLLTAGKQPIVLVGQKIRPSVKRLTHATLPDLVVLSHSELTPDVQIQYGSFGARRLSQHFFQ